MKSTFVWLFCLISPVAWAAPQFSDVLGALPPGKLTTLTQPQVSQLLSLAAQRGWNVFDLLDETGLYLRAANKRVLITGNVLRAAAQTFELGGRRVDAFFPIALVDSLAVGARLEADTDIEVRLSRPFSAFLELGNFDLQTVYGFREVKEKELSGAFGVTVHNGLFHWSLQKVTRVADPTGGVNPNFVAIQLDGFFKAKRWKINPITALGPPPKPKASS